MRLARFRYIDLIGRLSPLSQEELDEGWHFCPEFDGLLTAGELVRKGACLCGHPSPLADHNYMEWRQPDLSTKSPTVEDKMPITIEECFAPCSDSAAHATANRRLLVERKFANPPGKNGSPHARVSCRGPCRMAARVTAITMAKSARCMGDQDFFLPVQLPRLASRCCPWLSVAGEETDGMLMASVFLSLDESLGMRAPQGASFISRFTGIGLCAEQNARIVDLLDYMSGALAPDGSLLKHFRAAGTEQPPSAADTNDTDQQEEQT